MMKSLTSCIRYNIRESHKTLEELETVHNKYLKAEETRGLLKMDLILS